jgi:hypothetical protein
MTCARGLDKLDRRAHDRRATHPARGLDSSTDGGARPTGSLRRCQGH